MTAHPCCGGPHTAQFRNPFGHAVDCENYGAGAGEYAFGPIGGPLECRDLHATLRDDGTPVLPLDHWGLGCPLAPTDPEMAVVSGDREAADPSPGSGSDSR